MEEAIRRLNKRQEELGGAQMDTLMAAVEEKHRDLFMKVRDFMFGRKITAVSHCFRARRRWH